LERRAGIVLSVTVMPTPEAAAAAVARAGRPAWFRDVPYGDGGRENIEQAGADPDDIDMSVWTGESDPPGYEVFFRCGRLFVDGGAEPATGLGARGLVSEMAGRMASDGLCGTPPATGGTTRATPPPTPPQREIPAAGEPARGSFSVAGDCVRTGQSLFCAAQASDPPGGVPMDQVRYMWYVDGALQGTRSNTLQLAVVPPGAKVVGVKAFTPDTTSTDTFTIPIR
jgi:hypothetical protein